MTAWFSPLREQLALAAPDLGGNSRITLLFQKSLTSNRQTRYSGAPKGSFWCWLVSEGECHLPTRGHGMPEARPIYGVEFSVSNLRPGPRGSKGQECISPLLLCAA